MSVGVFMGIGPSFTDEARDRADAYVDAINRALRRAELPEYHDPSSLPNVYVDRHLGRSALDNHSATRLMGIADLAGTYLDDAPNLKLLEDNPFRVSFVPLDFQKPLVTDYKETIEGRRVKISVGSAQGIHRELCALAPVLGIPLKNENVSAQVAKRINALEPLADDDDAESADERTAWLLLFEGARLALKHNVALSLAG